MTENKGEWIEMTDNYDHSSYFCSRCGTQEGKPYDVCPNCKADMLRPNCVTCDHFGKCEGCEKGDEE